MNFTLCRYSTGNFGENHKLLVINRPNTDKNRIYCKHNKNWVIFKSTNIVTRSAMERYESFLKVDKEGVVKTGGVPIAVACSSNCYNGVMADPGNQNSAFGHRRTQVTSKAS